MTPEQLRLARITDKAGNWDSIPEIFADLTGARGRRAGDYHDAVVHVLERHGFLVRREFPVAMGNGRAGRIDVVASRPDAVLALELDNRTPRPKSIRKLDIFRLEFLCATTAILLRNPA